MLATDNEVGSIIALNRLNGIFLILFIGVVVDVMMIMHVLCSTRRRLVDPRSQGSR